MIRISRHNCSVKVTIETGLYNSSSEVYLYFECGNQMFADLLTQKLGNELSKNIQAIRQEEYEKGWKDAKAKKAKTKWFSAAFKRIWNR